MPRSSKVSPIVSPDDFNLPYVLPAGTQEPLEFQVAVMGLAPLLTHSALSMLEPKEARGNTIPTPEEEAAAGCYVTEDGRFAMLGIAFQRCLVEAASLYKAKGRLTMQSYVAHVEVVEDLLPLIDPETRQPLTEYVIDRRTAIVQRARIVRARPRFNRWAIPKITFRYDPGLTEPAMILKILADGGVRRGVGDFRPGKSKGGFGRFAIVGVRLSRALPWEPYQPTAPVDIERFEEEPDAEAAQ